MKKTTKAPKTNGTGGKHVRVIRIVQLVNPATKREGLERVNADGEIGSARQAKKWGVTKVRSWTEIETTDGNWAAAAAAFRAGKGKRVSAGK